MVKITEFKIEQAIIHVLDLNCDEPILTESYLNLSNEDINIFLNKHLEKILKDEELNLGKFNKTPSFINSVESFLNGDNELLDISREISINFFEIVSEVSNSSCDLLFLKLKTEFGDALCMIKLDYIKNYVHEIQYVEEKMKINIVPQFITLPNSSQRLNKACLFFYGMDEKLNLLYLDKNEKNTNENMNYFKEQFLNCYKVHSDYSKTKDLIATAEKWTRKNIKDDADKAFFIRESLRDKLINNEELNINEFAREVFKDDSSTIESFVDFVECNGLEGDVKVNKDYIDKKYERIRLKIDKDIDLYINKDSFYDINRFEVKRNGDGSLNMVIKYVLNYNEK